jgi:hypothetical protein
MRSSFALSFAVILLTTAPLVAQDRSDPPSDGLADLARTVRDLDDTLPQEAETPSAAIEAEDGAAAPSEPAAGTRPPPLSEAQTRTLQAAVERGQQLASLARIGAVATQDMLARVADPENAGITGWIALPEGNGVRVIFYGRDADGAAVAVYRAVILGPRVVSRETFAAGARPALDPIEARMADARDATEGLGAEACGAQPFNVFVIPPVSARAPIEVYQINAMAERGHYPLGRHFRSAIAADGTVADRRAFADNCADFTVPETPAGQQPQPVRIDGTGNSLPTEMHVFLSIWSGRALLVTTADPRRIFFVTGERIATVTEAPAP